MSLKVFIVDDAIPILIRLTNMLSGDRNIKLVGIANNAAKALEYITKSNPDLIILDIHMPDGSGIDILRQIKKENPSRIVVILTNYIETDYREICKNEGADYFLDKSIEFEKVIEICKNLALQTKDNGN